VWNVYITENLAIGNIAPGAAIDFDLVINSQHCKIVSINIVQLTDGVMQILFSIWESTAARAAPLNRANLYQQILMRNIDMAAGEGAQYGESLAGDPLPYKDRDAVDEERTYQLHCRLENLGGGIASDFTVSVKIADMGENV
jgi:hypothetical protein